MSQKFMHLMPGPKESELAQRLTAAGLHAAPSGRLAGGIHVRYRTATNDEAEIERIVAAVAPGTSRGPGGAPTVFIEGYRDAW
jgi:hypothetical protein